MTELPQIVDLPVADWVNPMEMQVDPYPMYRWLREESPVAWVPAMNMVLATSYSACAAMQRDQEVVSARGIEHSFTGSVGGHTMLSQDDPEHAVARAPINPVLRPRSIDAWVPVFASETPLRMRTGWKTSDQIMPTSTGTTRPPAQAKNVADLLGMANVAAEDMHRWSAAFIPLLANFAGEEDIFDDAGSRVSTLSRAPVHC